jgi:hypothetical protein
MLGNSGRKEKKNGRTFKPTTMKQTAEESLKEIPAPIGDFILSNGIGRQFTDGRYYHYTEVCELLRKYALQQPKGGWISVEDLRYAMLAAPSTAEIEKHGSFDNYFREYIKSLQSIYPQCSARRKQ